MATIVECIGRQDRGQYTTLTIATTDWVTGATTGYAGSTIYSDKIENTYPATTYDILSIVVDPSGANYSTENSAWEAAKLFSYSATNKLIGSGTAPSVSITVVMYVTKK